MSLNRSFYRGRMLPVLAACTTAAACDGTEIGPPLWVLATAMIGIFLLLIGGAIAIGAVYRHKSLNGSAAAARADRPGTPSPQAHVAPPAPATPLAPPAHPVRPAHPEAPRVPAGRRRH